MVSTALLEYHIVSVKDMIQRCLQQPCIQNEFYCQVIRQTQSVTDPDGSSVLKVHRYFSNDCGTEISDAYSICINMITLGLAAAFIYHPCLLAKATISYLPGGTYCTSHYYIKVSQTKDKNELLNIVL